MRPHHRPRVLATVCEQRTKRVEHVPITQVPGFRATAVHRPVVLLGTADDAGVLRRVEEGLVIFGEACQALP